MVTVPRKSQWAGKTSEGRRIKCNFTELDASVKALGGFRLQPRFRDNFRTHWSAFSQAVRSMKESYRQYWEAMDQGEKLDRKRELREMFNQRIRLAEGVLAELTAGDRSVAARTASEGIKQRVQNAITDRYSAVNSANGKP